MSRAFVWPKPGVPDKSENPKAALMVAERGGKKSSPITAQVHIFTPQAVKTLCEQHVVFSERGLKRPDDAAFEELARKLSIYSGMFHVLSPLFNQRRRLTSQAIKSAKTYLRDTKALCEFLEKPDRSESLLSNAHRRNVEQLKTVTSDVRGHMGFEVFRPASDSFENVAVIKNLTPGLAKIFREAMASTNGSRRIGANPKGPLAKFVSCMLEAISNGALKANADYVAVTLKGSRYKP